MKCHNCEHEGAIGRDLMMVEDGMVPGIVGMKRHAVLCNSCRPKFTPTVDKPKEPERDYEYPF